MSVTASNAAISAGMAAQASAQANRAHADRCKTELLLYNPKSATVQDMQSYAACVQVVHPDTSDHIALKLVVGLLLAMVIGGAVFGWVRDREPIHGALSGFCLCLIGLLFTAAVVFLFS